MSDDLIPRLRTLREQQPISIAREELRETISEAIAEIVEQTGHALRAMNEVSTLRERIRVLEARNNRLELDIADRIMRDAGLIQDKAEIALASIGEVLPDTPEPVAPRRRSLRVT